MVHGDGAVGLDAVEVVFDDENAVANAGIVLVSTLAAGSASSSWPTTALTSRAVVVRATTVPR